ncbi:MAG: extracellular solute-binding protein [Lachnospiraceae bacterium]|nr:extracellular solute-binding protein [Lachnospiraceae bacterium]
MKKALLLFFTILFLSACSEPQKENTNTVGVTTVKEENDEFEWRLKENRETLILGLYPTIYYDPYLFRKPVFDFNMSNAFYQIEIKEYADSSQLHTDIITGKAPDIILLPTNFMMDIYAGKGVLVDLNPLLDNDLKIKRSDLQENILEVYEVNGQLLGIPIHYFIKTISTSHLRINEKDSWTIDEMIETVNKYLQLPEANVFWLHTKSGVLDLCLMNYVENLIGWNNDHTFDRDLYIKILNFANQFTPDHLFTYEVIFDLIRDNRVQFSVNHIRNIIDIQLVPFQFGEPVIFIGYPTEEGSGNIAHSDTLMAINQNCANYDVAWSFIRSLFAEEYQINSSQAIFLPIRKSALEEIMKKEKRGGTVTWRGSNVVFEATKPTEVEKQQLRDLIESVTQTRRWDVRIEDILKEEAQSFLTGLKSAEEAADIAANRIEIYISEMR